ncbi:SET domain containing protein [Cryptosporidium ryanae]|uniref:SET domain containing protein n=1 Tax=Cryptosporidium ryanae TaxID=515981 RepID=UPI00351A200D|nr:SET domain containing protein [Cryptosporidium ryanae]
MSSDRWLSSGLQTLYNETKDKDSRTEIRDSYARFDNSLTNRGICGYVSEKMFVSRLNGSSCWKASEAIAQGELLISEKAVCWDVIHVNTSADDATLCIWKQLVTKCEKNAKLRLRTRRMFPRNKTDVDKIRAQSCYCKIPYSKICEFCGTDGASLANTKLKEALRLYLVVKFNQMSMNMLPETWRTAFKWSKSFNVNGLFLNSSRFDHSCEPNVVRFYIGTVAVFRASRNISSGETLSISYIENEHMCDPLWVRYCELNFWCLCSRCRDEVKQCGPNLSLGQAIKASKRNNPRFSLFDTRSLISLRRLNLEQRIALSEEIVRDHFTSVAGDSPRLVFSDVSKVVSGLVLDHLHSKNFERSMHWIHFLVENCRIKDETVIPLYLLLGVLTRTAKQNRKQANLHFRKAVKVFKTVFGGDVRFFIKRYWGDIRFAVKCSNNSIKDKQFFHELRQMSSLVRKVFSS